MRSSFKGRVLVLGSGAVSQCFQALLLRHLDFQQLTVMDMIDARPEIAQALASGATFVQRQLTQENLASTLEKYLGRGGLLIDLAATITREREQRTLESLLTLPVSRGRVLWTKARGALYRRGRHLRQAATVHARRTRRREQQWAVDSDNFSGSIRSHSGELVWRASVYPSGA